jgi:hypothetical protein
MALSEHLTKPQRHSPAKKKFHPPAAGQEIFDSVRQPRPRSDRFKFVAMRPFRKGTCNLVVNEKPVSFVGRVQRHPPHGTDLQFHPRTCLNASASAFHPDGRERGTKKCQSVFPLMEPENDFDGRAHDHTLYE